MSEELLQSSPFPVGRYLYYRLGTSSLAQLVQVGVVSSKLPNQILKKKPDGLLVLGKGAVKAYIEYKRPSELNTPTKVAKAIKQEIEPAHNLCSLFVVSDGQKTYWINPHTGNPVRSSEQLPTFNAKSMVDGTATAEYLLSIERVVDQADHSLSSENDELHNPSLIDPSILAQSIWQKIWINTGKEPEKCLYNVVELFVFKFLSDLSVLGPYNSFENICAIADSVGQAEALTHYANISRPAIRNLFPDGKDGTGIINGTIFVNEMGQPNSAQARLFCEVLNDLRDFDRVHGSFKYIEKEFKTRLYESFLRQGAGLHHLGQFFTPRNVVRTMVEMSGADNLPPGSSLCDPFCGVGGFLLETILQSPHLMACFQPTNGTIEPKVSFVGYDRGSDEKEDERTIILAKANALVYFSDLIAHYNAPGFSEEFTNKVINPMFVLVRTNLGTFGIDDEARHDLILTNPPYVTSGSGSLKNAIKEAGLSDRYGASGRGTESLAVQWIVRSLKPSGTALVIVPDGLLNQKSMLQFIKERCVVKGIVSLPARTFYATPKKTYILAVRRKFDLENSQTDPVFAYLVSETGESRDANRWPIDEDDLPQAAALYNQFKGSPNTFVSPSTRCKVVPWPQFNGLEHWMVDRICWSPSEVRELGIEEEPEETYSIDDFNKLLKSAGTGTVQPWPSEDSALTYSEVLLGDDSLFSLYIGRRVLKRDCIDDGMPCISANVRDVFGYIAESKLIKSFDVPSLTWGIDGNFDWFLIAANYPFHPTDHCGVLRVLDNDIDPDYLYRALRATRNRHGFDRTYRANLKNVERVSVEIPIGADGQFDLKIQREIAAKCAETENRRKEAAEKLRRIADANVSFF